MPVDRPIIFSGAMVSALLAGTKTQTRRLAWRNVMRDIKARSVGTPDAPRIERATHRDASPWQRVKPGDRLWVREAAWIPPHRDEISESDLRCGADTWEPSYHADGADPYVEDYRRWGWKSRPSIHMPRWASRLTLTVTEVRVQRLQEMTEGDALAEGVYRDARRHPSLPWRASPDLPGWTEPRGAFASLWNSLHGPDAWAANPEVVALTFTVEQRNIDAVLLEVANG